MTSRLFLYHFVFRTLNRLLPHALLLHVEAARSVEIFVAGRSWNHHNHLWLLLGHKVSVSTETS